MKTLPDAMASVLAEHGEGLTVAELVAAISIDFPYLLDTPGRQASPVGLTPRQALASAISSTAGPKTKRFGRDTSTVPMRIYLRSSGSLWTTTDLEVAVRAYLQMRELEMRGEPYVKIEVYRSVARSLGRSEESVELRMRNISAVLSLTGRRWIRGLLPARNVGSDVAYQIEAIIASEEGRPAADEIVGLGGGKRARRRTRSSPIGAVRPDSRATTVRRHVRDSSVREWILECAAGVCELCGNPAPFEALSGAFLEVHHVRTLADHGADCVWNAVALCPNCHRRLHYSLDAPLRIEELYDRIERLRRF